MAATRTYRGEEIFQLSDTKLEAIVEGLLYENDTMMIVAPPKMSKTVFSVQLACNISSGTPFLGILDIPKPCRVLYIATEMKDEELKDRFIRTAKHVTTVPDNLILVCTKGSAFKLNTQMGHTLMDILIQDIRANPPKVIFIDSVYKAFHGSLKDDDSVNEFLTEVDRISAEFDAAVVLVHHLKKASRDMYNNEHRASDADTYGSQFLLGAVDQVVRLEKIIKEDAPMDRYIQCDTQRTGNIITNTRIRLHQPDPLYFHLVDNYATEKQDLMNLIKETGKPMSVVEMMTEMGFSRSKIYHILKEIDEQIVKTGSKTKYYGLKGE